MTKARTWSVRLSIDDLNASFCLLESDQEVAAWARGLMRGLNGGGPKDGASKLYSEGWEIGETARNKADEIRASCAEVGRVGGSKKAANARANATPDALPDAIPVGQPERRTKNEEQETKNEERGATRENTHNPPDHSDLIPPKLKAMEFLNAWGEWLAYQAEKGYPVLRQQAKFTLLDLANNPGNPHKAAAWIAASISKGLRTISEPFQASPGRAGGPISASDDEIRVREIKRARNGLEAAKARGDKGMVKEMEERLQKLGVAA